MSFRNISAWCIRNPVPPIVMFVLLMLAGIVSFNRMDVNDNPDIEFPAVQVIVAQPGGQMHYQHLHSFLPRLHFHVRLNQVIGVVERIFHVKHAALLSKARQEVLWTLPHKIPVQMRKANEVWE